MLDLQNRLSASVYPFFEAGDGCEDAAVTTVSMGEAARRVLAEGLGVEVWVGEYDYRPFSEEAVAELEQVCRTDRPVTLHTRVGDWDPPALEAELAVAERLDAEALVVHVGTLGLSGREPDWGAVGDFAARARDGGFVLALENSGRIGIGPLCRALEEFGDDPQATGLGFCLDVGHAQRSRPVDGLEPSEFVSRLGRAIVEVHVQDNLGREDLHRIPGRGTIDWDILLPALDTLSERTVVCLETKCFGSPLETIRAGRRFLMERLARSRGKEEGPAGRSGPSTA
jgi:sugar phosphate isomerase/epimerase